MDPSNSEDNIFKFLSASDHGRNQLSPWIDQVDVFPEFWGSRSQLETFGRAENIPVLGMIHLVIWEMTATTVAIETLGWTPFLAPMEVMHTKSTVTQNNSNRVRPSWTNDVYITKKEISSNSSSFRGTSLSKTIARKIFVSIWNLVCLIYWIGFSPVLMLIFLSTATCFSRKLLTLRSLRRHFQSWMQSCSKMTKHPPLCVSSARNQWAKFSLLPREKSYFSSLRFLFPGRSWYPILTRITNYTGSSIT